MPTVTTPPPPKPRSDEDKSVIDMSKMSTGQRAALQVTEAARESHEDISFVANLVRGRWTPEKLYPVTDIDAEEKPHADKFLAELAAYLREHVEADLIDRTGEIPSEVQRDLVKLGAYGIKIPKKYGGLGFSQTTYCQACLLIASHCSNVFAHLSVHQSIGVPQPLLLFGTEEQKARFLPRVAGGELSAFALTEAGVGSDPPRLTTEAKPDGDDYILNGEKLWCSNGTRAGLLIVACKTPPKLVDGKPRTQITTFVVEAKSPGISVVHRRDARRLRLHDEGGDLRARLAVDQLGRRLARDDEQTGASAVGAPELFSVKDVVVTIRFGLRREPGGIRADARLGEREGGQLAPGDAGQESCLLLLGAEEQQRLRHADRLVHRKVGEDI